MIPKQTMLRHNPPPPTNTQTPVAPQQPVGVTRSTRPIRTRDVNFSPTSSNVTSQNVNFSPTSSNVTSQNVNFSPTVSNVSSQNVKANVPVRTATAAQASAGTFQDHEDRAYSNATERYLNPQWDRAKKDFDQNMINRGIDIGTEAYNTAFDNFSRSKNDAYSKAAFDAMGYGRDSQNMAFGQSLANANLRQQTGLANQQAGIASDSMNAQIAQNNANRGLQAGLANQAHSFARDGLMAQIAQSNANRSLQAGLANQSNSLAKDGLMAQVAQNNANRSLQAGLANQSNSLAKDGLMAQIAQANANRDLQAQGMSQSNALARDNLIAQIQQQNANRDLQGQTFNANFNEGNRRFDQQFDLNELNALANIDMQYGDRDYRDAVFNAQRDDIAYNRLASILSGMQLGGTPQIDTQGAYNTNAQMAMNNYNNQMSQRNNNMGGLAGLAGSVFGAAGSAGGFGSLFSSDRRLKENIEVIGQDDNGLTRYSYNYIWSDEPQEGYMADEVEELYPEAVLHMPNGYSAVDYGML